MKTPRKTVPPAFAVLALLWPAPASADNNGNPVDIHRMAALPADPPPSRQPPLASTARHLPLPPQRPHDLGATMASRRFPTPQVIASPSATSPSASLDPADPRIRQAAADPSTAPPAASPALPASPDDASVLALPSRLWRDRARSVPPARLAAAQRIWPAGLDVPSCQTTTLPPAEIERLIREASATHKVDARFATLIARDESQYGAVGVSEKGALGVMQLMPGTAERYRVANPCDPIENIRGGVAFLADLFREFGHPMLVAAAYNAGPGAVYEARGVPRFPETVRYVASVSNDYFGFANRLARADRGSGARVAQAEPTTAADVTGGASPAAPKRPELNWIGGHVLNLD